MRDMRSRAAGGLSKGSVGGFEALGLLTPSNVKGVADVCQSSCLLMSNTPGWNDRCNRGMKGWCVAVVVVVWGVWGQWNSFKVVSGRQPIYPHTFLG